MELLPVLDAPGPEAAPRPAPAPVPVRAAGLELLGTLAGSGYERAPSLVRRADGQTLQLTPILYATLEAVDGRRTHADIAAILGEQLQRTVGEEDVAELLEQKLRPLGVLVDEHGAEPEGIKANPLLALRFRYVVTDPKLTDRLTAPFTRLFLPPVVAALLALFVAVSGWLFFVQGLAPAARQVLTEPALLVTVFGLTLLSAGFHELGHAAACRYGGARPGAMGVGLYLVFPAFYTDVTSSYALDRRSRLRVDLGGLYFNAVFAVGAFAGWAVTGWDALLVLIPLQQLQMLRQLLPMVRLDGYHVLADLTGVPDLFAHIGPTMRRLWPTNWGKRTDRGLRPWARRVVTAWVLLVVPVLLLTLVVMVLAFPRLVATAWAGMAAQWDDLVLRWTDMDVARGVLSAISLLALALPVLSTTYMLGRIARRTSKRLWGGTDGKPGLRSALVLAAAGLALLAGASWWPQGQYEVISAEERWTVTDLVQPAAALEQADPAAGAPAPAQAAQPAGRIGRDVPTVVVVIDPEDAGIDPAALRDFDFQTPDAPGEDDNQAVAENHVDGSIVRVGSASLVWVFDGVVDSTNEAWAVSNCQGCVSEALAYQAILVVGTAEVVAPSNVAVAVNAECLDCVSNAIARQLVLTLGAVPDDATMAAVDALWAEIEATVADLGTVPLEETLAELDRLEAELVDVLEPVLALPPGTATTTPPTSAPTSPTTGSTEQDPTTTTVGEPATSTTDVAPSTTEAPPSTSPPTTTEPVPTTTSG